MKRLKVLLLAVLLLPLVALAQNAGSAVQPAATTSTSTPSTVATTTPSRAVPKPRAPAPASTTRATSSAPLVHMSPAFPLLGTTTPVAGTGNNTILWLFLAVIVILPFGFLVVQLLKKKESGDAKNSPGCMNIKKLLENKLEEITDLKGRVEGKLQDAGRERLRDALQGTHGGEALALLVQAEKHYSRLKKLYDECMVEFKREAFKGAIIEQSLRDTRILDAVHIEKKHSMGDWTVNYVLVGKKQIPELSNYLNDGPWYIHLWKTDTDDVKVVFKNKIFDIKSSDTSTWAEAIAYGRSLGVPKEQLDFPVT